MKASSRTCWARPKRGRRANRRRAYCAQKGGEVEATRLAVSHPPACHHPHSCHPHTHVPLTHVIFVRRSVQPFFSFLMGRQSHGQTHCAKELAIYDPRFRDELTANGHAV